MRVGDLEFPDDVRVHPEHDTWARPESDGCVRVGITALGTRLSGEVYMCRPKPVGSVVGQGRALAVVELAKAIVSVRSPVAGTVVEVNDGLAANPERVHQDPYGAGWIVRLRPDAPLDEATGGLLAGAALAAATAERIRLERLDGGAT